MKAQQLFEQVTAELIADIEAGAGQWRMPWHRLAQAGTPTSIDGRRYRGINALWLPLVGSGRGWVSGKWATYRAWQRHGAQVRSGEKGTAVVLWKQATPDTDGPPSPQPEGHTSTAPLRWYARTYTVFAAEQVDGADHLLDPAQDAPPGPARIATAEAYFAALGATVTEHSDRAYYTAATDTIVVPPISRFDEAEHYYATLAHEHVHWTAHPDRCDRDLTGRFGSDAYAAEELIAETGAAMWCAQAGIAPATRHDHAAYIAHWLDILRACPRHLVTVASKAQTAIDWMQTRVDQHATETAT